MQIIKVIGREILDSRGNPTIEADVILNNGITGRASVPAGASKGSREAYELRDIDSPRYAGKGVRKGVYNINNEINKALYGLSIQGQPQLDTKLIDLDGTPNKSRLGANALLAVSLASARAYAASTNQPLYLALNERQAMSMPVPLMNVLNGGAHADNNMDFQEVMLMPIGASDFPTALQMAAEIFYVLKNILKKQGLNTAVGDEGGFAPNLKSNQHALDLLVAAVEQAGYSLVQDIVFALDIAASEFFIDNKYHLTAEKKIFSSNELIAYYEELVTNYPIISIEDGIDEQDWLGWEQLTSCLGHKLQIVGDDLFVTNVQILQSGINRKIANAILIKLNQIGTLTETRQAINLAQAADYKCIISHRSGETEDSFIADLAVATGCGQIKTGSLCRSERVAKYNQLLRINETGSLPYAGVKLKQEFNKYTCSHLT